ncbi:MAG TPA: hypothetical protein ENI23_11940 [bacterium]|nr:hypothetical protein [bacterium]
MRLTDSLLKYMADLTERYCEQCSMETPFLWFTTREVKDAPASWTKGRRTSAYHYYGVTYHGANAVFINVRLHKTRKSIQNTVSHELVHLRFPYLSHGIEFDKKTNQIIKGKVFPPYKGKIERGETTCH